MPQAVRYSHNFVILSGGMTRAFCAAYRSRRTLCFALELHARYFRDKNRHRIPASVPRNFCVARNSVFLAVSSVVLNISPMVRSLSP